MNTTGLLINQQYTSPISRSTDYIFTRLVETSEGDGILQIGAVTFYEVIPLPIRPRVFQRKSLRGQTQTI